MSAPSDADTPCGECGMPERRGEFHPYIACLAFKACQSSKVVRENLNVLEEYIRAEEREACARIAENEHLRSPDGRFEMTDHPSYILREVEKSIAAAIRGRKP